jgi:hypothetical protein
MIFGMRVFLIALALAVFVIQVAYTVFNQVNWPFCSHNFYYHRSDRVKPVFRVRLTDNEGEAITVECRQTLPIEGYRCGSIYREVFVEQSNAVRQQAFAALVLSRLNAGGWKAFDERFPPALPKKGKRFTSLVVEKHFLDTRPYAQTGSLQTAGVEHVYTYHSN